jgi:hypothetical protein
LPRLRAKFSRVRLRFALRSERAIPLDLLGACPLRFQLDFAGLWRPFGVPRLVLLARHRGHFGLLDQARLEQLFLKRIHFRHVAVPCRGFPAHHTGRPRCPPSHFRWKR